MIGNAIMNFIVAVGYLLQSVMVGVVRFVVTLLGPGLTVALVVLVAALWYLGWLPI
jgi:uncharacterized protein (DUF697 family)